MRTRQEQKRVDQEAGIFWARGDRKQKDMAHWRGFGRWKPDAVWFSVGLSNLKRFKEFRVLHPRGKMHRMLEWGTGGGCNVVAFAKVFPEIIGVDISLPTLLECQRQVVDNVPSLKFTPVYLGSKGPEAIHGHGPFDFFFTSSVIQHMPSHNWVERFLLSAAKEMRHGGQAFVQFLTLRGAKGSRSLNSATSGGSYLKNVARWCLFDPEEFMNLCGRTGWRILQMKGSGLGRVFYMEKR